MPGTVDWTNDDTQAPPMTPVLPLVFIFDPTQEDPEQKYTFVDNIKVLTIQHFEYDRPAECLMRYQFNSPFNDPTDPTRFEQVLPVNATSSRSIKSDTRLVVRVYLPDGSYLIKFDGHALCPQGDVGGDKEMVTFMALAATAREKDEPMPGAVYRDGSDMHDGDDVPTARVIRFNPDGKPNCTADTWDHGSTNRMDENPLADLGLEPFNFPVFWDYHNVLGAGNTVDERTYWTLGKAARYLMFSRLLTLADPTDVVKYLTFYLPEVYDEILESRKPAPDPNGVIDPNDPTTYEDDPIEVQDLTIDTEDWQLALRRLIEPEGFAFRNDLSTDANGDPQWLVKVYRKDTPVPVKSLSMQPAGNVNAPIPLDTRLTNLARFTLQRDNQSITNAYVIDTHVNVYEMSAVLAPAFAIVAADALQANLHQWIEGKDEFDEFAYRYYIADETGQGLQGLGHWHLFLETFIRGTPLDLSNVFAMGDDYAPQGGFGGTNYAQILRPGKANLLTKDDNGALIRSKLFVSTDYAGVAPAVWDGTGTWQEVVAGGWEQLHDRLGIRLTMTDPENWKIGPEVPPHPPAAPAPFPTGVVRVVSCMANPGGDPATPRFYFRLLTVIEADWGIKATADRRTASPTSFSVRKRLNAREWFHKDLRHKSSDFATKDENDFLHDDTLEAGAQAYGYRKATEVGTVAGPVTINRFTDAYQIGDRIDQIVGRNCSLQQNIATQGEAPVYPAVISIRWNFDGGQSTTLELSDRRAPPPPERRR
jgi:hypothetical protein